MKILVVGKGGREHALALAASRSSLCDTLYMAPGNPGMRELGECVPIQDDKIDELVASRKKTISILRLSDQNPL